MRFATYTHRNITQSGAVVEDVVVPLNRLVDRYGLASIDPKQPVLLDMLLADSAAWEAASAISDTDLHDLATVDSTPLADVRLKPPIQHPSKFIGVGLNYHDHAREAQADLPTIPMLFAKFSNCLVGNGEPIVVPSLTTKPDYEGELAFVMGKRARNVDRGSALQYVAGYTIVNDVSARDYQKATSQFTAGKMFDTFAPCGPWLTTSSEVPHPDRLSLRTVVNGELRQDSNTSQLIFDIPHLIEFISSFATLEPGDIIATGTPGGVGGRMDPPVWLKSGDVVRIEIEGLGVLENPVVSSQEST
ncbi:MAG: fumarylacetoacetate hydrolase family protein [Acidimicrobiia bacterium]